MSETTCQRCGRPAKGGEGNPDARMMRRAQEGNCVDCAVVVFLQRLGNMHGGHLLREETSRVETLRLPHMQEQFAAVMKAGLADANPDDIDWERVIELWDITPKEEGVLF